MQTAGYTSNINGRYPLSTQTLDFIQAQILLLQQLGFIGGSKYLLRTPDGTNSGLAFINGELLEIAATPAYSDSTKYLIVSEQTSDIVADGDTYTEARKYRSAYLSTTAVGSEYYAVASFNEFLSNTQLNDKIKQVPQTVLNYLTDILAAKMPLLTIDGMTMEQLNGLVTPCVANCRNSVKAVGNAANYSLHVTLLGAVVRQEITLPNGDKYVRTKTGEQWSAFTGITESLHIEVKLDKGTVYLRHGVLPADTHIVLLRKKKRSAYRRTGGSNSRTPNIGRRMPRMPKTQYVHYKGIVLSKGTPNSWYAPRCIAVANSDRDGDCINKEIAGCCRSMVTEHRADANGNTVYRMQGVRNWITNSNGKHMQHQAYAPIAVQVVRIQTYDNNISKQAGGEMVKMKYWLRRKKVLVEERWKCRNCGTIHVNVGRPSTCRTCGRNSFDNVSMYTYSYYRVITLD